MTSEKRLEAVYGFINKTISSVEITNEEELDSLLNDLWGYRYDIETIQLEKTDEKPK